MDLNEKPRLTVLIVDDDPDDQLIIGDALEDSGFVKSAFYADDGIEALDFLLQRHEYCDPDDAPRPDMVFLDLNMPRCNGFEMLQRIQDYPEIRRIPCVILSTTEDRMDIQKCHDLGASSFVTKPVNYDELVRAMKNIFRSWSQTTAMPRS